MATGPLTRLLVHSCFPTVWHYALSLGLVTLAELVYVVFGFGAGLIAVGTLAHLLPSLEDVVVLLLLVNAPTELWIVSRGWRRLSLRGVAAVCVGIGVGVPLGGVLLDRADPTLVLGGLGAALMAAGLAFVALRRPSPIDFPWWTAPIVGLLSGGLSGLYGTGGPPLILYYQLAGLDKTAFRGQLVAIFSVITVIRLPLYGTLGMLTTPRLLSALLATPAIAAGLMIGNRVHLELDDSTFRRLVGVALALLGALLLARQLGAF